MPNTARNYPQPREGITGTDRTGDDLLSLADEAIPRRLMMVGLLANLRKATQVGNPAPIVERMRERMRNPQPGDLVVEDSGIYLRGQDKQVEAFGILLTHRDEWWQTDEEWAAVVAGERTAHEEFLRGPYAHPGDADEPRELPARITDHAWYIQYGPKAIDVARWVNCSFIAIPTDPCAFDQPVGTITPGGVELNRNNLLDALADSGFSLKAPRDA